MILLIIWLVWGYGLSLLFYDKYLLVFKNIMLLFKNLKFVKIMLEIDILKKRKGNSN